MSCAAGQHVPWSLRRTEDKKCLIEELQPCPEHQRNEYIEVKQLVLEVSIDIACFASTPKLFEVDVIRGNAGASVGRGDLGEGSTDDASECTGMLEKASKAAYMRSQGFGRGCATQPCNAGEHIIRRQWVGEGGEGGRRGGRNASWKGFAGVPLAWIAWHPPRLVKKAATRVA